MTNAYRYSSTPEELLMQNSQLDPLKIICLEEHISDPDLAAVSAAIARHGAPYRFDTGTMYRDDPAAEPQDRPRLEFPGRAVKLTSGNRQPSGFRRWTQTA